MFSFFRKKDNPPIEVELTPDEEALVQLVGIQKHLALNLKSISNSKLRPLTEWPTDTSDEQKIVGLRTSWKKNYSFELQRILVDLAPPFHAENHQICFTTASSNDRERDLVLVPSKHQNILLQIFDTNGINSEVGVSEIIAFFDRWQHKVPIQFVGVDNDSIDIHFAHLNFDMVQFFEEALVLCPDFESVSDDAEELAKICKGRKGYTEFWWD